MDAPALPAAMRGQIVHPEAMAVGPRESEPRRKRGVRESMGSLGIGIYPL